jgi:hypothetical protein
LHIAVQGQQIRSILDGCAAATLKRNKFKNSFDTEQFPYDKTS